jgi:hypothetical protein
MASKNGPIPSTRSSVEDVADFHPLNRFNAFSDGVFAVAGVMRRVLFLGAAFTIQLPMLECVDSFPHGFFGGNSWTILRSSFIRSIRSVT